jgi:hypothetical protein
MFASGDWFYGLAVKRLKRTSIETLPSFPARAILDRRLVPIARYVVVKYPKHSEQNRMYKLL